MKLNNKYLLAALAFSAAGVFAACSDDDFTSNDPDADFNAPAYHDVNDRYQTYTAFWKPADGWVGDPMPMYDNCQFNVFFLHDARDGAATFHPIALASTSDFVNYDYAGIVIPCGEDNSQEDALGTGCIMKSGSTYYAFYTGHNQNLPVHEKIFMATSSDLKNWQKQTDFVLEAPEQDFDRNQFRDPFVFQDGDVFRMLVTTRGYVPAVNDWQAVIAQYTSSDLKNWTLTEPFFYNGENVLECPDYFVMGNYEYLVYSNWDWANNDRRTRYVYREKGSPNWLYPARPALDDYYFYAGKTASDGTHRYLFGWIYTRAAFTDATDLNDRVWAGNLVAHLLVQNSDGTLNVAPATPLSGALAAEQGLKLKVNRNATASGSSYTLNGGTEKALAIFDGVKGLHKVTTRVSGSAKRFGFEFGASGDRSEVHDLTFNTENNRLELRHISNGVVVETRTSVELPQASEYDVTIINENSVCVIYVNGVALTNRIYQMNWNGWGLFAEEGTATFNEVKMHQ